MISTNEYASNKRMRYATKEFENSERRNRIRVRRTNTSTTYNSSKYVVLFASEYVVRFASECERVSESASRRVGESHHARRTTSSALELGELALLRERRDLRVIKHEEVLDGFRSGSDRLGVRRVDVDRVHDERGVVSRDARSLSSCEFTRVVRGDHIALDEKAEHRESEMRREDEHAVDRLETPKIDADYAA